MPASPSSCHLQFRLELHLRPEIIKIIDVDSAFDVSRRSRANVPSQCRSETSLRVPIRLANLPFASHIARNGSGTGVDTSHISVSRIVSPFPAREDGCASGPGNPEGGNHPERASSLWKKSLRSAVQKSINTCVISSSSDL